jgi:hypothetical protein
MFGVKTRIGSLGERANGRPAGCSVGQKLTSTLNSKQPYRAGGRNEAWADYLG